MHKGKVLTTADKQKITKLWSPSSPDLNPTENLWSIIKTELYEGGKNMMARQTYGNQLRLLYQKQNLLKFKKNNKINRYEFTGSY